MKTLEAFFTPADFAALRRRNLDESICVVFDVFRATSAMITALGNGAAAVVPVDEIPAALALRQRTPGVLLAGERDGVRIRAPLTGGTDFDLGNSPREFTREKVAGKTIVTTTTNGTRALRSCAHAGTVLAAAFLNLQATADSVRRAANLLVVCSGTFDEAAYEDVLAAGALCDLLWPEYESGHVADSARMARELFLRAREDLLNAAGQSRNGRRLLAMEELREDVPFCLQRDLFHFAAKLDSEGKIVVADGRTA